MKTLAFLASAVLALAQLAPAAEVAADFSSATSVPVTAASYTATGNTVNLTLNFAPPTGTTLTVVNNMGPGFISGVFDNLAQWQRVSLPYAGGTYEFLADYCGGSGNDLVLVWANTRILAWGDNLYGKLGDGTGTDRSLPVEVNTAAGISALSGKTVVAVATGYSHSLALCSDGTVTAWGYNYHGQLGDGTTTKRSVPVAVNTDAGVSVLSGKTVVAVAAGAAHSLALCSDGTLAAWGSNYACQLGDNTKTQRSVPVAVDATGASALYGKTVVAVAAGFDHSLALCSDGTVVNWGNNSHAELGDGTSLERLVPVAVSTTAGASALAGKVVVAVAAGGSHSVALCSDGSLATWGSNNSGQLGDNTTAIRSVPLAVNRTAGVSALSGKTVVAVAAGGAHSLALCSDRTVVAWGSNYYGQLGVNSTMNRPVPVAVNTAAGVSALAGKTVVALAAGSDHSLAFCSDGTTALWGYNVYGQLGDATTISRSVPVAINTTQLAFGERFVRFMRGSSANHALAFVAVPYAPDLNLTSNGALIPDGSATPSVANHTDFGSAAVAGGTVTRTFTIQNTGNHPLKLTGTPKVVVSGTHAADFTVTSEPESSVVAGASTTFQITFTPGAPWTRTATVSIASDDTEKNPYDFAIQGNGSSVVNAGFSAGGGVPLTINGLIATGSTVNLTLNFAPPTGTNLTVLNNTGLSFIKGTFDNLAQGQKVELPYGGITYEFVANYYGGSGNDLVLVWANHRTFAWGSNSAGQLGDNTALNHSMPTALNTVAGVSALSGKTVVAVAAGQYHSLALCSDGTVAAWGANSYGQLGDGTLSERIVPVVVNTEAGVSALSGKTVVAVAAGLYHSLALCSDGTVAAWGSNSSGQLADMILSERCVPVAVNTAAGVSALSGKSVVAVAAGGSHSLALCSDGTVAAWGNNYYGQLGDNTKSQRSVPVAVNTAAGVSVLAGKTAVTVAAGYAHSLALCSDGTVATWGLNDTGQLGDKSMINRLVPVAVNTTAGVSALAGKTVVAVVAGSSHCQALCLDGTVATWGSNSYGQLGDGKSMNLPFPVAVNTSAGVSALAGKMVVAVAAGGYHNLALCSDSTVAAWGSNASGQLGDATTTSRSVPVAIDTTPIAFGERFTRLAGAGSNGSHTLALVAVPYAPDINLAGNGTSISVGSATPGLANYTDFGSITGGGSVTRTFIIQNTGNLPLNLTGTPAVEVVGAYAADFTVTSQPVSPLAVGASTTFQISFAPSAAWLRAATVRITSDDPNETPFEFAIQGTGTSTLNATFATGGEVPLTTRGFTATGSTVNLSLNHAPATGTELMVIRNTGIDFINGTFDNLAQGQRVALLYCGISFEFVADYFGGNGNDLVLVWANQRAFAWGSNSSGQLGNHTTGYRPVPVAVNRAAGVSALAGKTVVAVATGSNHNLALCSDGTVAAWGSNSNGQLGDNTATNRSVPVAVNTAAGGSALAGKTVVAVAAGASHSLAFCSDGTVAAWGDNSYGQLGDNTKIQRVVPVAVNKAAGVSALSGKTVVAVAAGYVHSLALCSDGTVVAWGRNDNGQLGDNTTIDRSVPVAVNKAAGVSTLSGKTVVAVAVGGSHSLALCSDGTVAAWGSNFSGQLGDNTRTNHSVPVAVNVVAGVSALAGKTVAAVAAGGLHSLVLCSDGTVAAWGSNGFGQLGDNAMASRTAPVAVTTAAGVSSLSGKTVVAVAAGSSHSLARCSDGTEAAWGFNGQGQLGDNTVTSRAVPVAVNASADVSALAGKTVSAAVAGGSHSLALCSDGTVAVWGSNFTSQLGDNTTPYASVPEAVSTVAGISALSGKTVVAVGAGGTHSLARCSDGTVASWGSLLGDGTTTSRSVPVAVNTAAGFSALSGKTVVAVAAGSSHSLALCSDGTMASWGSNSYGQFGDATTTSRSVPVAVNTAEGVSALFGKTAVAVAAGGSHSLALCSDGTVVAWGDNSYGQLGSAISIIRTAPSAVNTDPNFSVLAGKSVVAIAVGRSHNLALCSDGTVAAWGYNYSGQLGDATTTNRSVPVAVNTENGVSALAGKTVVAVAAGSYHSLALCSDGTLVGWGSNASGQLGDGTTTNRTVPTAVSTVPEASALAGKTVVAVNAGDSHSLALCSDGTAVGWGNNTRGQLGDGTAIDRSLPAVVVSTPLAFGERFTRLIGGSGSSHTLALAAIPLPALPSWRLDHFGSGIDSGDGADLNDFDQDGLSNLLEFAFGLDPKHNSAGQIPAPQWVGSDLVIAFTQPAGVSGISYAAEWSETLEPGSWTAVPDTGNPGASPPQHTFLVPVGTKTGVYLRLKVRGP